MREHFSKYGEIVSIKLLESENEGFVTFTCDEAAHYAFMTEKEIHNLPKMRTEIAYAWHQPGRKVKVTKADGTAADEPDTPPILELCDDILFMIFDRCNNATLYNLSETCVRFNSLLLKQYQFPNIDNTLRIEMFGNTSQMEMTLIEIRKMLRLMGHHFTKLIFFSRSDFDTNYDKIAACYLQQIIKYCKNIQHMKFDVMSFRNHFIPLLQSIRNDLNTLEIDTSYCEVNAETDFTELLPKLKKFNLRNLNESVLENCMKNSWPSLEIFRYDRFSLKIENFFALNPQLRCLELSLEGIRHLETATRHLPNIDQLNLSILHSLNLDELIHLQHFLNLTVLKMDQLPYILNVLCGHLIGLNNLKKLQMSFRHRLQLESEDQQAIVSLVKINQNIEQFGLSRFTLNEATVVEIVRFALKLKALRLENCNIGATDSLITKLANIRSCNQENLNKLELWIDEDEQNDLDAINENEAKQYLTVKFL